MNTKTFCLLLLIFTSLGPAASRAQIFGKVSASYDLTGNVCGNACLAQAGDANSSGDISIADVSAVINFVFRNSGHPDCASANNLCWLSGMLCRGDWNADRVVTLADAIRGVNFIFGKEGGPWLAEPCGFCCLPFTWVVNSRLE
jgi:hypothetical protein